MTIMDKVAEANKIQADLLLELNAGAGLDDHQQEEMREVVELIKRAHRALDAIPVLIEQALRDMTVAGQVGAVVLGEIAGLTEEQEARMADAGALLEQAVAEAMTRKSGHTLQ